MLKSDVLTVVGSFCSCRIVLMDFPFVPSKFTVGLKSTFPNLLGPETNVPNLPGPETNVPNLLFGLN